MDIPIIYEDKDLLAVDKPAGISVFPEGNITDKTVIDFLIEKYPDLTGAGQAPRYGVVHRLDKDTSGILLVAKRPEAFDFLQKQFLTHTFSSIEEKNGGESNLGKKDNLPLDKILEKRYIALVTGTLKEDSGTIQTFLQRSPADPRKQRATESGEREAITEWKVLQRFEEYTLLEVNMKTGRKHQIRAHLAHIHHPIAGDKIYGFKDSPCPAQLRRQFLHASYLKIQLPDGKQKELHSELPEDLKNILTNLGKTQ